MLSIISHDFEVFYCWVVFADHVDVVVAPLAVVSAWPVVGVNHFHVPHFTSALYPLEDGFGVVGVASPSAVTVAVLRTTPAMATPQGPVCEVRLLVVHRYQPGVQKLGSTPCEVEFFGRRGKPVKKMRLIPAEKAFAFARKLQGTPGCTVSVC